jgi:RNA polymerase sigma-70 factor (ECF subfamily)
MAPTRAKPNPFDRPGQIVDLIGVARQGSATALGQLLEQCRDYLLLIANQELDSGIRRMIAPSDLVQETFVKAQQGFATFRGQSEAELLGWLRMVLLRRRLAAYRRYQKIADRGIDQAAVSQPAMLLADLSRNVVATAPSPSDVAGLAEQTTLVDSAIAQLPPDYQTIVRLRYWEQLRFVEIGPRMGRSPDAARKLWFRAVERLGRILERASGQAE